jgi:hypothetical protein
VSCGKALSWETVTKVQQALVEGKSLFIETTIYHAFNDHKPGVAKVDGLQVRLRDGVLSAYLECRSTAGATLYDDTPIAWSEVEAMNWQAERFRQLIEQAKAMGINVAEEGNDLRPA